MAAATVIAGDVELPAGFSVAAVACLGSSWPPMTLGSPRSPDPFFALTTKSVRITGGVILLGGRGHFHVFILRKS
jgi:hypothetical protein